MAFAGCRNTRLNQNIARGRPKYSVRLSIFVVLKSEVNYGYDSLSLVEANRNLNRVPESAILKYELSWPAIGSDHQ